MKTRKLRHWLVVEARQVYQSSSRFQPDKIVWKKVLDRPFKLLAELEEYKKKTWPFLDNPELHNPGQLEERWRYRVEKR
jgi:hypothetical protein